MNYYLGQIGIYGFNFAPRGWAFCAGAILPIAQNTALYSLLGTTYGGNGQSTFGLPDLRSRTPICYDGNYPIGEMSGVENVTLLQTEMPAHTHLFQASSTQAGSAKMDGKYFAEGVVGPAPFTAYPIYGPPGAGMVMLNPMSTTLVGGSQPHNNIQPSLGVNYCIATTGYYPSRN